MEIVAGRMITPAFGGSVFTWGSIIGVFLAALSLGYALGGRYAREYASRGSLVVVLGSTTALIALIAIGGSAVVEALASVPLPEQYDAILPVTVLFGPLTVLIGLVSPFAAELSDAESTGGASGRVYAVGTIGSIVGAFGATFVLIPTLPVPAIGLLLGGLLVLGALSIADRSPEAVASIALAVVVLAGAGVVAVQGVPTGEDVVVDTQTAYAGLQVVDDRGIRTMYVGGVPQSAIYVDGREGYVFDYAKYAHVPLLFQDDTERALFIGGGGFTIPQRYVAEYPGVTVDAVEVDPTVVGVARDHFGLQEGPRMNVHVGPGRTFLRETNRTYDVIVLDAFRADQVPFQFTTREFMALAASKLDDDGVLIANVITARSGEGSAFGRAMVKTMATEFPRIYQFATARTSGVQNIELVASKSGERYSRAELRELAAEKDLGVDLSGVFGRMRPGEEVRTDDVPVLTDDYAPVDRLLDEQVGKQYVIAGWNGSTANASG